MAKASTLIAYTVIATLIIYLISKTPSNSHHQHDRSSHRRLKLRSGFDPRRHSPIPFDPIIAEMERRREDRELEKLYFAESHKGKILEANDTAPGAEGQPEWEDFMNAEDYLNDEERFNVSRRIIELFPKIDEDPVDGYVSLRELSEWNLKTARKDEMHRSLKDMEIHDKNRDGFVSFHEYEPPSWSRRLPSPDGDTHIYENGWWKEEHFNAADGDGDGLLNQTEFHNFLHPVDSDNPKLLRWLSKEEIRERDTDKDGKLSFKEFFHGLFDLIRDHDDHNSSHPSHDSTEAPAKNLFAELDKNKDGYLSEDELVHVIDKIHPTEHYYAKEQAEYALNQADTNHDGYLSLDEMLENPYVFYTAIFTEEEDDDNYHDEFR